MLRRDSQPHRAAHGQRGVSPRRNPFLPWRAAGRCPTPLINEPNGIQASEKIQITGNSAGQVLLTPLTDGPYQGMVLWQDRNSTVPVLAEGNGNFNVQGTFYAANATLNINGNASGSTGYFIDDDGNKVTGTSRIGSQYISQDLSLGGNGNVSIKYSGPNAANIRILDLVE
jgi:hypothetical protein